MVPTS